MKNKFNIVSGETYTLAELFYGDRRIVIPDLQRDYCWGDETHTNSKKELVGDFVRGLVEVSKDNHASCNIGMLYGYEAPVGRIQLCDGQQRITTLYLLLCMLNRQLGDNSLRRFLLHEAHNGSQLYEPYLQYAIRESTLFFLRDFSNWIVSANTAASNRSIDDEIRSQDWYFIEYDSDPSTQSMMKALKTIHDVLSTLDSTQISELASFLVNGIRFLYYDVENRHNGEETFVVINTTGEPLSATENLKPLAISSPINECYSPRRGNIAEDWEEIETWFWLKRANDNDTAETGFNEFLRWVTLLHYSGTFSSEAKNKTEVQNILSSNGFVFPVKEIPFQTVYDCWKIVKDLFDNWNEGLDKNWLSPKDEAITQIDCFKLLPLVAWRYHHNKSPNIKRKQLRVYRYFENLARLDSIQKSVNDLIADAIAIVFDHEDIVEIVDMMKENTSQSLCPKEEYEKLCIIKNSENRISIEEEIWKVQAKEVWQGEIAPLINWSTSSRCFDFALFKRYANAIEEHIYPKQTDEVRRALLAQEFRDYPLKCGKNLSFCDAPWQWKEVIKRNSAKMKDFLDGLLNGKKCSEIIAARKSTNEWIDFIDDVEYLALCGKKNIQIDENGGILLLKGCIARTYCPLYRLKVAKDRFGAEEFLHFDSNRIGFQRELAGEERYFQWWLYPNDNQADLYLMNNGSNPDAYAIIPGNENTSDDLQKYRCIKITDTMTKGSIVYEMLKLVAAEMIDGGDTLLQKARDWLGAEDFLYFDSNKIGFKRTLDGNVRCFQWRLHPQGGQGDLYLMDNGSDKNAYATIPGNENFADDLEKYRCIQIDKTMTTEFITEELRKMILADLSFR